MKPMRILIVAEHFPSLSETFVLNQVTGLLDRGHDVEVYPIGNPDAPVVHPDVETYQLNRRTWQKRKIPPSRITRAMNVVRYLPACIGRLGWRSAASLNPARYGRDAMNLYLFHTLLPFLEHRRPYDIIHCHFGDKGALAQRWREMGVVRCGLTVVFHAQEMAGLSDEQGRALYGQLFRSDALLLPISAYWQRLLIRWGARPERCRIHHMGVDCEKIQLTLRRILPGDSIQLLSVCRLVEKKGIEFAIRAVAKLQSSLPHLHYRIAGGGPLQGELQELVKVMGINRNVEFLGPQPQDRIMCLLRESHLLLAPSVTSTSGDTEGIPVALMEAMAGGLPAIGTHHTGIPELITHGKSGMLVEERDVDGLARAIESLVRDPVLYARVAQGGRTVVDRDFNICTLNERLENIFQNELSATGQ